MEAIKKIAEMAKEKSWQEITDRYILPEVLKKGGAAREYKISDEYMEVVAEYTQIIYPQDPKTADLLLEFALQRTSCGAVDHTYLVYASSVPQKYMHYSAFKDKPAPMSDACFDFLERALSYALVSSSVKVKKHASEILFTLIYNLDYKSGKQKNGLDLSHLSVPAVEVKNWAWDVAASCVPFEEFWKKLVADGWTNYRDFFTNNWQRIDIPEFHRKLVYYFAPQTVWPDLAIDGWERHIGFFHEYWLAVDTKRFFEIIGVTKLTQKAKILLKIKYYQP